MIFGHKDSDYQIMAEYITETPLANILVSFDPNPATEYKYSWLNGYYYWSVELTVATNQDVGITLRHWLHRDIAGPYVDYSLTTLINYSEKLTDQGWFDTNYITAVSPISRDLNIISENKPYGYADLEEIFIGRDDLGQLVYCIGVLRTIGSNDTNSSDSKFQSGLGYNSP